MKTKKYTYLYVLQGNYGCHGWEDLTAEEKSKSDYCSKAWKAIKQTRQEYRINEGGNYRIINRRELRV